MKFAILISFFIISANLAQVTQEWVSRYNGPGNAADISRSIAVDNAENVYVTGVSPGNGTQSDFATIKYNSAGIEQWAQRYDGYLNSQDAANAIAIDSVGNVYVTGGSVGNGTNIDYTTIKYNSAGVEQWLKRYNGPGNNADYARAIAVDNQGNVYITGESYGGATVNYDYATVKYNSEGVEQWVQRYAGTGNSGELAKVIAIDNDGNVYVTGVGLESGTNYDYTTIKYNSAGVEQWVRKYNGPGNGYDVARAVAVDNNGNVYVTGESPGSGTFSDYATIKYNSTGVEQWVKRYNGTGNGYDIAYAISIDNNGNICVTGGSRGSGSYNDYATIKYNSAGVEQWVQRYNGPLNNEDQANAIEVDNQGNVYVTGESYGNGTNSDYAVIKYNSSGDAQWVQRYNGPAGIGNDFSYAITVDKAANVYVTGGSGGIGTNLDYATVKYSQSLNITSPVAGEKWIAGEVDTIKWTGGQSGQLLNIHYSTNNGTTFTPLTSSVLGLAGSYVWSIPKTILSTKVKIRLNDVLDTLTSATSDSFKIKPYIITRIDSITGDYITYNINTDRWGFRNSRNDVWDSTWWSQFNYQGVDPFTNQPYPQDGVITFRVAASSIHPDWVSWVNTFGTSKCYHDLGSATYNFIAILRWQYARDPWNGSCFGIAISNALAFYKKNQFLTRYPAFPNFTNPISVTSNNQVKKVVNELFTHQFGEPHTSYRRIVRTKTPNQTLADFKSMLIEDNVQVRTLEFLSNDSTDPGGHEIIGYKVEQDPTIARKYNIYVYDNSFRDSLNAYFEIDTIQNTWTTYYGWTNWGGSGKMYLRETAENYLSNASFSKSVEDQSPFILGDTTLQIFLENTSSILVSNEQNESIGYMNGVLIERMPSAFPFIIVTGGSSPPKGYDLITDNYSVSLNNFSLDTFSVGLFTSNKSFVYKRDDAINSQTDRLFFDGGVSAINPDNVTKTISLLNLINETTQEKLFYVSELELAQNDSVKIINPDDDKMNLENFGSAKNYKLELNLASTSGLGVFVNNNISLAQNSTHNMVPDWSDYNNLQLLIYIDEGNNGTIDDTLEVANQSGNPSTFPLTVMVDAGWNMVSTPGLHPDDQNVTTWWPGKDPAAGVFRYNNGYNSVDTVSPGSGYWMKHLAADTLNTGDEWPANGIQTVTNNPIDALSGWNLIGGYENTVSTSALATTPPGLITGSVFGYSGGYNAVTELLPGYAYWVKLSGDGQINIPSSLTRSGRNKSSSINESWGKIVITDAEARNYTLYAVDGNRSLDDFDLPPLPPAGIFDIRFGSNRFAENLNGSTQTIEMSGVTYPVTVKVEEITVTLQDETGNKLNVVLHSGEQVVINDLAKIYVSGENPPVKYSLEQNYPNPFNPVTTIKYSIPQSGSINLTIYDILGSVVTTLVNEEKPAGVYEVNFDASALASGIYFYRIQAGPFVETKKMILIK